MASEPTTPRERYFASLTKEERKSLTHGEFWIPEEEREIYKRALDALNAAGIPYVVTGAYAIYEYTGIYRETTDLDLFAAPQHIVSAMRALRDAGFRTRLEAPHWLAKAKQGDLFVDLIFGMGNGLALVDEDWYRYSRPAILAARPVRVAPPEELIWHRLFIGERHRFDMADVVHLILHLGLDLDWNRLLQRVGDDWRLLGSQIHFFDYVYPEHRNRIPDHVRERLQTLGRAAPKPGDGAPVCRGTMLSLYSFAIDVNEWGFRDIRREMVARVRSAPIVDEIRNAGVWDE
jgi:hypothetical protein